MCMFWCLFLFKKQKANIYYLPAWGSRGPEKLLQNHSNLTRKCAQSEGSSDKILFTNGFLDVSRFVCKNYILLSRRGFSYFSVFLIALRSFTTAIFLPVYILLASSQPSCFGVRWFSIGGYPARAGSSGFLHYSSFSMEKHSHPPNRGARYEESNESLSEAQGGGFAREFSPCDWSNVNNNPPPKLVYGI